MVGLRAQHNVHIGRAPTDLLALGLGDAARDGDHHGAAALGLHLAQAAEVGEHLLRRLLADVAGVEDDEVGILGCGRFHIAQRRQHIAHALAVIDVHLAAIGLDEDLLGGVIHGPIGLADFGRGVKRQHEPLAHLFLSVVGQSLAIQFPAE